MFKWFKKSSSSSPSVFWRYSIVVFGLGLIVVFIGQTVIMFLANETGQVETSASGLSSDSGLDPKRKLIIMKEIDTRPSRLESILATTTIFVDPSL